MTAEVSDEQKHAMSVAITEQLDMLVSGHTTLTQVLAVIDQFQAEHPGEDRQQRFYRAVRALVGKVAAGPDGEE